MVEREVVDPSGVRVLTVTHYFATNGYGIEGIAAKLNDLLRARGFPVRWLASRAVNRVTRSLPSGPHEIGIPSWDGIREATDLAWPLFGPWQLPRIAREVRRAEVVHLHEAFFPINQVVLWLAVFFRRPIVITQHIADMPIGSALRGNAVRLANLVMTRPAFARATRIVYYSRRTQEHFTHLSRGKDAFVWNGCDSDLFQPVSQDEAIALRAELDLPTNGVLALFVGRFIEKKGLPLLRRLAADNPTISFAFVGNGPLDPRGWELPNVSVRDAVPQVSLRRYYQTADVLLLPAVGEGFPLVVQEACCCGVPVVVSREVLDACPELAPFAYEAGDAGARLAEAFTAFLAHPEPVERAHERATIAKNLWSWERCGDAYAEIFRTVVAEHRHAGKQYPDGQMAEESR
jgi:glycosyltransferase involved in cell wall biosynthesis